MKITMKSYKYIIVVIIGLILISCSHDQQDPGEVVVRVDRRKFRKDEIAFAYELAPSQLTKLGKNKALDLLTKKMINRKLLADEAKTRDLDRDSLTQRFVNYYEKAEIMRQLYLKHIRDSVNISEKELKKAFHRDKQVLLVKHYVTDNRELAARLHRDNNIPEHIPLLGGTRAKKDSEFGYIDSIEWNTLDTRIEDLLYNLPLAETSQPVMLGGHFHLFKVVDKNINVFNRKSEYFARKSSIESTIRRRREHNKAFRLVKRVMTPQNLVLKGKTLNKLADYLYTQYQNSDRPNIKIKNNEINLDNLKATGFFDSRLAEYRSGSLNVSDFFFYNRINPQSLTIKSKSSIRNDLADIIAIYVRDEVFAQLGEKEGLDKMPQVKRERQKWEEKILANRLKRELYQSALAKSKDDEKAETVYQDELKELITQLRNNADIRINKEKLYNIETTDEGLPRKIDFFAKTL